MERIRKFAAKNKITYYIIFILFIVYEKVQSCLYIVLRVFPIDNNKIVFCSAQGKRYGDNPMYISDELLNRKKNYKIVWLLKKEVREEIPAGVKRVNYNFFTKAYELVTAKVWVDSNWKCAGVLKRKEQLYIQTWHGSYGLKKIGMDLGKRLSLIDKRNYKHNKKIIDLMLTNSKKTTEIYKSAFEYNGKILEYGSPRNDVLFQNTEKICSKVRKYFNLQNQKIVLYAPTFRNNYRLDEFRLDYERLAWNLHRKYGGEWVVLVRLHPNNLGDAKKVTIYNETVKNASEYSIMQDLIVASDILITDYSSCMFDFVTTGKTVFLYATDVEQYRKERDYYFELEELPFPLAQNNEQLEKNILEFDENEYRINVKKLFEKVGLCESGEASQKAADYIENWIEDNKG